MDNIFRISLIIIDIFELLSQAQFHDWPMWRYDYNRSASTPEQLADKLYLQWQVKYSARTPVWDDPLNQNLMQFDRIFEPIVADNKIFLGFNDKDKVIALDINSGKELWHYYADGPVRLPLAANNGKIYFTSDDGNCYCLNTGNGSLVWKLSPAFADVAPQGSFTISGDKLLVAGGRSVPAAFDLKTGEELYYQLAASGKTGGAFTCSNDRIFFNHHRERRE